MNKLSKWVMISGSCLWVACVSTSMADDYAEMKKNGFKDALSTSKASLKLQADDAKLDKMVLVAQATPATSKSGVYVRPNASGADVGVVKEFSSWSDLTAVFRPSRWSSPVAEGGSLSWLNYKAWSAAPGRTGKVLLGEVVVAAALYWTVDELSDGDGGGHGKPYAVSGDSGGGNDGGESPF